MIIEICCHEGKQQSELTTDSEVKSQKCSIFLPCFVCPYLEPQIPRFPEPHSGICIYQCRQSVPCSGMLLAVGFFLPQGRHKTSGVIEATGINKI